MTAEDGLRPALDALRAGQPVALEPGPTILSVETASEVSVAQLDARAILLLSGERAAALGLGNEANAADPVNPVAIAPASWLDWATARQLADPGQDLARGPLGPLYPQSLSDPQSAAAAINLARLAGLLPALWLLQERPDSAIAVPVALVSREPKAVIAARAHLPIEGIDNAQIVAFRDSVTGSEEVALVIGAFGGKPPLIRLHSECLTGDVFGSLKCDCGPQLKEALRLLGANGGGILLYLRQEGRGIGLVNKIRAYQLQDRGLDTVDANRRLGFADDSRDYRLAAAMLRALGVNAVRMLTNNPAKIAGLAAAGIDVVERVAHRMPANPHNADYLATKRSRSGHL